jgi:hypothetical protein
MNTGPPTSLTSSEDWDRFLTSLTVWRLAISKIEVITCLERLDLDDAPDSEEGEDVESVGALQILSSHLLDRVCAGEGGDTYLGEDVVACYYGKASNEVRYLFSINRMASRLTHASPRPTSWSVSLSQNWRNRFKNCPRPLLR